MSWRPDLEKLAMREGTQPEAPMPQPSATHWQLAAKDAVARQALPESALVLEH